MNTYVINPFYIYLLDTIGSAHDAISSLRILCIIIMIVGGIFYLIAESDTEEFHNKKINFNDLRDEASSLKTTFTKVRKRLEIFEKEQASLDMLSNIDAMAKTLIDKCEEVRSKLSRYVKSWEEYYSNIRIIIKSLKYSAILCVVLTFLNIIIPSKDTCYKMFIASMVTYENIDTSAKLTKDAIEQIITSIENVIKNTNNKE